MTATPWNDIASTFTTSWGPTTVGWIVISGIIAGVVTQILKFVFEQTIPQWQRKKATRIAIQKYNNPISQSAYNLITTIKDILEDPDVVNNQNRRLSILFDFGCFFGWIQIL